ncbi:hypothetical protein V6N13_084139 [Hibiscus sabdariffa]
MGNHNKRVVQEIVICGSASDAMDLRKVNMKGKSPETSGAVSVCIVWGYSSVPSILGPQSVNGEVGGDTFPTPNVGITNTGWPLQCKQVVDKCEGRWYDWLTAD